MVAIKREKQVRERREMNGEKRLGELRAAADKKKALCARGRCAFTSRSDEALDDDDAAHAGRIDATILMRIFFIPFSHTTYTDRQTDKQTCKRTRTAQSALVKLAAARKSFAVCYSDLAT